MEADYIKKNNLYDIIDMSYFEAKVQEARDSIEKYSLDFIE